MSGGLTPFYGDWRNLSGARVSRSSFRARRRPADGQAHTPADGKTDDASDWEGHDDVSSDAFDRN